MTHNSDTERDPDAVIRRAICRHLGEMTEFVIIESAERSYYVQAVSHVRGGDTIVLHAETASDEFLEPRDRIGQDGAEALRQLGWNDPDPNWWKKFVLVAADNVDAVAEDLLTALREAYGYGDSRLDVQFGKPIMPLGSLEGSQALRDLILALRAKSTE